MQNNRKELDIMIPKKSMKKKYGVKLRNRIKINNDEILQPKVNQLIQLPKRPYTPEEYVREALNSEIRIYWI